MASESSQKFIARNRAPRVQIEYDVEIGDATKKIQLPFVMGVFADLSGKSAAELPDVNDRGFAQVDIDNFESYLKAQKPSVSFKVDNKLDGGERIDVNITFESMDDFSPAAIAQKVDGLKELFETRTKLANLLEYMDGKSKAKKTVAELLKNDNLLKALGATE